MLIHNFDSTKPKKGTFLAASPFISNHAFKKAVILILEYNESIVSGVKINHNKNNNEENYSYNIHDGGTTDQKRIMLLHSPEKQNSNTVKITDEIYVTDLEGITNFYPKKHYAVSGYVSWIYEDFMSDIKNSEWIPVTADSEIVFDTPIIQRWYSAYFKSGIRPEFIQREA